MNSDDIRTLKILEGLEDPNAPSQRDLAKNLNLSIGLVNAFVKRMVAKGYFKLSTIPRNRVKYILTPKGLAEKTRLTYEFVQYSIGFYRRARERFSALFASLAAAKVERVVLYGAVELTEIASVSLAETPSMKLSAVVDPERTGKRFLGHTVMGIEALHRFAWDRLVITDPVAAPAIRRELGAGGVPADKIVVVDPI